MLVDRSSYYVAKPEDVEFYERLLPSEHPLDDALQLIPWNSFTPLLESYYSSNSGQPAIPPLLFLKLEFLRYHHRLSDREVINRAVTDVAFRWFLEIPVNCTLPHPTSLVYFRGRLGVEGFKKVFDQLVTLARQAGLVRDRLRLKDASHVIAKIAVPSTIQLLARLRDKMLIEVRKIDPSLATGFEIERDLIREESATEEADVQLLRRVELLQQILEFLQSLPQPAETNSTVSAWQERKQICDLAVKILDDSTHTDNGDRILSLVDSDARRGKHGQWYDGYSIDISMDADSNLITAVDVLVAGGDEAKSAVNLIQSEHEAQGNHVENLSIDGVGFNGPMLRELESPEGLNVTVFTPTRESGSENLLAVSEFAFSDDGTSLICPAGKRSSTRQRDEVRHRTYFQFRRDTCAGRVLLAKCKPTLGAGVYGGRGVTKNDYEAEHERARSRSKTAAYAAVRREHPAIERKLNEVMNQHGGRRAKYWGKEKTKSQAFMTCFTVNVKRIHKLLLGEKCTPTR